MTNTDLTAAVADFVYHEALLLDEQRWAEWLALYAEDAVFWVPTYTMAGELVTDPELSINLIYIPNQSGLEDRIFRLETKDSLTSTPLPRTSHMITNLLAEQIGGGEILATASFQVSCWSLKRGSERRAGRYKFLLRPHRDSYLIAQKYVLLVDEVVDGWFDFFSV